MNTYFKGLNGLRAIASITVLLGHIELIKSFYELPNLMDFPFYKSTNGHLGVILFFVLSGFLITYFLLQELEKSNRINLMYFYKKRALRILPLYFVMIIISLYVYPIIESIINNKDIKFYSLEHSKYYLLVMPNIAKSLSNFVPGATHLWSIGVEEQFYLIWPILLYLFRRRIVYFIIISILFFTFLPHFIDYISLRGDFLPLQHLIFVKSFLAGFKVNIMAIGSLLAFLHHKKLINYKIISNKLIGNIIFITSVILWINGIHFGIYSDEIYACIFSYIIINTIYSESTTPFLENKTFSFLGKISYGIYVYHWIIILIIIELINSELKSTMENNIFLNIVLYSLSISLTIIISYLSYKYFELPILKLKNKLS